MDKSNMICSVRCRVLSLIGMLLMVLGFIPGTLYLPFAPWSGIAIFTAGGLLMVWAIAIDMRKQNPNAIRDVFATVSEAVRKTSPHDLEIALFGVASGVLSTFGVVAVVVATLSLSHIDGCDSVSIPCIILSAGITVAWMLFAVRHIHRYILASCSGDKRPLESPSNTD